MTRVAITIVACLGAVTGCQSLQTYPATSGRPIADANVPPMPEVCVLAIKTGHSKSSVAGNPIIFNLPPGMNRAAWSKVDAGLPETACAAVTGDTAIVSVEEVRINGGKAEVDVVVPQDDVYQSFTIHMTGSPFGPWRVTYIQPWTLRTAVPTPNSPWKDAVSSSGASAVTTGVEH